MKEILQLLLTALCLLGQDLILLAALTSTR